MDIRGIALVALLIFISGLIAYFGNYVGRKVGKRRVSIFNLRPKYTSIIITIITGALIVSVTLIALFAFSEYARTSFFGLRKIVNELESRKHQLQESTNKYERKQKELELSTLEYTKQGEELRTEIEKLQKAYAGNVEQLDEILGKINLKSIELNELKESHGRLTKDYEKLKKETDDLRLKKDALEEEIKENVENISELSVESLYGEIIYVKDQLLARVTVSPGIREGELKTQLLAMINTILGEAVERGALVDKDTGKIFNEQFKGLLEVLRHAEGEVIVDALAANNVFKGQQMYIKLRPVVNRLVFVKGEVIVEQNFSAGMPRKETDQLLSLILYQVSIIARKQGMISDPETQRVGSLSAKRYLEIVDMLTEMTKAATVRAVAVRDTKVADGLEIDFTVK